jgi:hypothetical protein
MVRRDNVDLLPEHRAAEILCGHLDRLDRAFTGKIAVNAGQVSEDTDANDVIGNLGNGWQCAESQGRGRGKRNTQTLHHGYLPAGLC